MKTIGLKEFLDQVKTELNETSIDDPVFAIQSIDLEITLAVTKGGDGKLSFQVVSVGGEYSREDTHNVKITLQPLIPVEVLSEEIDEDQKANAKRVLMRGEE